MTPAVPLPLVVPVTSTMRARVEHVRTELLADLVAVESVGAQLDEVPARGDVGRLEVAGDRLGDLARVDLPVGELDGGVAVLLLRADLGDDARPGLDDGHRNDPVVLVEDLGHAELLAQNALCEFAEPAALFAAMSSPTECSRRRWPAGRCA